MIDVPSLGEPEDSLMVMRDDNELANILTRVNENQRANNVRPRLNNDDNDLDNEPRPKRSRTNNDDFSHMYKFMETFAQTQNLLMKQMMVNKEKDTESTKEESLPDKPEKVALIDWPNYHVKDDSVSVIDAKLRDHIRPLNCKPSKEVSWIRVL